MFSGDTVIACEGSCMYRNNTDFMDVVVDTIQTDDSNSLAKLVPQEAPTSQLELLEHQEVFQCEYMCWDSVTPVPVDVSAYEAVERAVEGIQSNDWQEVFVSLGLLQQLCKYHPEVLLQRLEAITTSVSSACGNLRSGVAKQALLTVEMIGRGIGITAAPCSKILFEGIVPKLVSEKRFLADASWDAARYLCSPACLTEETLKTLSHFCSDKNARIVAKLSMLLNSSVELLIESSTGLSPETVNHLIVTSLGLLQGKLSATKQHGRRIVACCVRATQQNFPAEGDEAHSRLLSCGECAPPSVRAELQKLVNGTSSRKQDTRSNEIL